MGKRIRTRTSTGNNPCRRKSIRAEDDNEPADREGQVEEDHHNGTGNDQSSIPTLRADMDQEELYRIGRQLEAQHNKDVEQRRQESHDALANLSNKQCNDDNNDEVDPTEVTFIESCGKKLAATEMLWFPENLEDQIFNAEPDESFNAVDRFSIEKGDQPRNKIQGALLDIRKVVPEQFWDKPDFTGWVAAALNTGMSAQHSFTAHRLRDHPNLFDCSSKDFSTSVERSALREKIGWKEDGRHPEKSHYDPSNVPLLHKDYNGKFDINTFMLNPGLFVVHAAITKGPATAHAMKNKTAAPKVQSVADLWGLKKTTPGMITGAAIWIRWVHSEDDRFYPVGPNTGIEWRQDFEFYLQYLTEGLQKRKPSVLNIFCTWDQIFYPNSDEGMGKTDGCIEKSRGAALEALNAEEGEDEDEEDGENDDDDGQEEGGSGQPSPSDDEQ